ncbi:hypothetical protein [Rhodococcus opacus]|uniref:hypothetical protein n=1 Tax=Rhodococcus opacus TaxID=37919 RepID=UPI0035C6DD48
MLIGCDRAAAYLLDDENSAARAAALKGQMAGVRLLIAREQHRTNHAKVIVLDRQRARFTERHCHERGPDPDPT